MNRIENIFVGTSFSGQVDYETGLVNPDFKEYLQEILSGFRKKGFSIFCAMEHEGWKEDRNIPASVGVKKDFEEIRKAHAMLAIQPATGYSSGLDREIGFATALGKTTIEAIPNGAKHGYFGTGQEQLGQLSVVRFDTPASLVASVTNHLRAA